MRNYLIRRLLLVIPTLFLATIMTFSIMQLIPGDIIDQMATERTYLTEAHRAAFARQLGLDVPVLEQYGRWIGVIRDKDGDFGGLLQGDLGDSLWAPIPVTQLIADRLPVTIELTILSLLLMIITSLSIGTYSAIRQDSWGDYIGRSLSTMSIALPAFWVALMIILFASLWFGMSPPLRVISFAKDPIGNLGQFIVPAFVLSLRQAGTTMRMTRSMMLEVLRQDYIRTAWAKGLRERVVVIRHALKNGLIPVVTMLGVFVPGLIGSAVIIETVFGLPGLGQLMVEATFARDYTLISGVVFCFAVFLILTNLAVDLTYGYLDPRVHYE